MRRRPNVRRPARTPLGPAVQSWDAVSARPGHKPDSDMEALMLTPPSQEPEQTIDEWHASHTELHEVLAEAVDQLPPRHRMVLEMTIYEGFSLGRIAHLLGLPKTTVHWTKNRALETVRDLIANHPIIKEKLSDD